MNKKNENSLIIKESFSDDYCERKSIEATHTAQETPKRPNTEYRKTGLTVKAFPSASYSDR